MVKLKTMNWLLTISLSLAAGIAKVIQLPDEVNFFVNAGLNSNLLFLLGGLQILAALLLAITPLKLYGAVIGIICFLISTLVILINSQIIYAVFSMLPILMSVFLIKQLTLNTPKTKKVVHPI